MGKNDVVKELLLSISVENQELTDEILASLLKYLLPALDHEARDQSKLQLRGPDTN